MLKEVTTRYLDLEERRWIADKIDEEIRERGRLTQRNAWDIHMALVRLNLVLTELMVADVDGLYLSAQEADSGVATILTDLTPENHKYVRVLAHEIAQHLMCEWVAPNLYDADEVYCTHQDNRAVRHQIAQDVDRRFKG